MSRVYIAGNTQDEIAKKLNVSRQSAQRLVSLIVSEKLVSEKLILFRYVPSLDQDAPRIIQKVMSYILDNFKDTVSLSEAAEIAGMGESSFSRFFKKNSGNNFVDYVRKLRVSHACRILSETNMPVTEVCFEVGYNNISNFNRHFLAEKGVTPSQYRRMSARKFTAEASG